MSNGRERLLVLALVAAIALVVGFATALIAVTMNLDDRAEALERRTTALERSVRIERRERRDLSSLVCVMAHVDDRADRIVIGGFERLGRLDRRAYLPDYPRC